MAERCRYCHRLLNPADPEHQRYWPFCGEPCKMAELGLWLQDRYVIGRPLDEVADDAALTDEAPPPAGSDHNSS